MLRWINPSRHRTIQCQNQIHWLWTRRVFFLVIFFFFHFVVVFKQHNAWYFMWNWVRFSWLHGKYSFWWKLKFSQELNKRKWIFFCCCLLHPSWNAGEMPSLGEMLAKKKYHEISFENCYLMWFNFNPTNSSFDPDKFNSLHPFHYDNPVKRRCGIDFVAIVFDLENLNGNVHYWNMHAARAHFWFHSNVKKKTQTVKFVEEICVASNFVMHNDSWLLLRT